MTPSRLQTLYAAALHLAAVAALTVLMAIGKLDVGTGMGLLGGLLGFALGVPVTLQHPSSQ